MNKYERVALDHYLNDYPQNMSYRQILDLILSYDDNDLITPCELAQDLLNDILAGEIDSLKQRLQREFLEKKK